MYALLFLLLVNIFIYINYFTADLVNVDPILSKIGYNGGDTPTFVPHSGSPAINFVASHSLNSRDQTGIKYYKIYNNKYI